MNLKIKYLFFFGLILMFAGVENEKIFAQTQTLTIGNLKGTDYIGCGCSFQNLAEAKKSNSQKIVFWSEDYRTAILNINGKDTKFKLTKSGKRPVKEKVGSRFTDEFAANGIIIKVDYLTTRVCVKGDEECEATSYDVTITALKGDTKTIIKTKGACGC